MKTHLYLEYLHSSGSFLREMSLPTEAEYVSPKHFKKKWGILVAQLGEIIFL